MAKRNVRGFVRRQAKMEGRPMLRVGRHLKLVNATILADMLLPANRVAPRRNKIEIWVSLTNCPDPTFI